MGINHINGAMFSIFFYLLSQTATIPETWGSEVYKLSYPVNNEWIKSSAFLECNENQEFISNIDKNSNIQIFEITLNQLIEIKSETDAYNQYKAACLTPNANNNNPTDSCIVHLIHLVTEVYDIDYPLTQCIMGRETIKPDGAPEQVNYLYQFTKETNKSFLPNQKSFAPSISWVGGKGLAQLTSQAIKAVQELLGNSVAPQRFNCSFYKKFLTFYKLIGVNPPDLFITHNQNVFQTDRFNPLNPFHSLSIGAGYIFDRTIINGKVNLTRHQLLKPQYSTKLRETIANGYNPGKPPYGRAVAKCAKLVEKTLKGVEIYKSVKIMYNSIEDNINEKED